MRLLGYEVTLFKKVGKGDNEEMVEVDLSKIYVNPSKAVKKEMERYQKKRQNKNTNQPSLGED